MDLPSLPEELLPNVFKYSKFETFTRIQRVNHMIDRILVRYGLSRAKLHGIKEPSRIMRTVPFLFISQKIDMNPIMLGTFLPNQVVADIAWFCENNCRIQFALSGPVAYTLANRYGIVNELEKGTVIQFNADHDNNLTVTVDEKAEFNTGAQCGTKKAEFYVEKILGLCRNLQSVVWGSDKTFQFIFNIKIWKLLEHLKLKKLGIYGKLALTTEHLREICSNVERLELLDCEVERDLITNEMFTYLHKEGCKVIKMFACSKSEDNSIAQAAVSDDYLNSLINEQDRRAIYRNMRSQSSSICVANFLTNFTIDGIKRLVENYAYMNTNWDFGILPADQAIPTLAFLGEMSTRSSNAESKFLTVNGHQIVRYKFGIPFRTRRQDPVSFRCFISFAVLLSSSVPSAACDDNSHSGQNLQLRSFLQFDAEKKRRNLHKLKIAYVSTRKNGIKDISTEHQDSPVLRIEVSMSMLMGPGVKTAILTNIDKFKAEQTIRTVFENLSIECIELYQDEFNDNIYEMLKPLMGRTVKFDWREATLSVENFVEYFTMYPKTVGNLLEKGTTPGNGVLPARYLTNEVVNDLLNNNVEINVRCHIKNYLKEVTTLTDDLLVLIAKEFRFMPLCCSIKGYRNGFTIGGINENLISQYGVIGGHSSEDGWFAATLDSSQEVGAVRLLSSIHMNPYSRWRIQDTCWKNGFLQSFEIYSEGMGTSYVRLDFASVNMEKSVEDKSDNKNVIEQWLIDSNYRRKGSFSNCEDLLEVQQFFVKHKLHLLSVLDYIYQYHFLNLKKEIIANLREMDVDFLFEDRFFKLPYEEQAFILNMIYKEEIVEEEHYNEELLSDYSLGYSDNEYGSDYTDSEDE